MNEQASIAPKKKRPRSPSYPGIDLEGALERAKALYSHEKALPAHVETILGHWGYKPTTGPGLVTLAALKKFGLLEESGSRGERLAKLSELALDILLDEREDGSARTALIREAALRPRIHALLWDEYDGSLPSDANLKFTLTRKRGFTETGAEEFIAQFRRTLAFAGLAENGTIGDERAPLEAPNEGHSLEPQRTAREQPQGKPKLMEKPESGLRDIQIPLSGVPWAILRAPFPMTEGTWAQMQSVLNAMKPALVPPDESKDEPPN